MKEDKWYHDIQAEELINLRDCKGVWIYRDRDENGDYPACYGLEFAYYAKSGKSYLHYDSSKLLQSAFKHYTVLLGCTELDVSAEPVTL